MNLLSFDIEIADVFDLKPGEDIDAYGPFNIAVACTAIDGGEERLWHATAPGGEPAAAIGADTARELLRYLRDMQQNGYMVCAWNGLGFDLRWIAHVAQDAPLAIEVALKTYDPMFQFFNQRGFPVGLEAVARGMNIKQGKLMNAADAPRQWQAGNHQAVMDYVRNDCRMTNAVVKRIAETHKVSWITKTGALQNEPMRALKTVEMVLKDPEPDQSWMKTPIRRTKFHAWMKTQ